MVDSSNKDREQIQVLREAEKKRLGMKLQRKLMEKKEQAKERLNARKKEDECIKRSIAYLRRSA